MTKIKNNSKLPSALRVKTEKCDTIWVNRRTNAHLHGETQIQNTRINRRRQTKCLKNPWFDAQIITRIYRLYFNILQWMSISFCQRVWIANKTLYIRGIKLIDCRKYLLNCENKIGCLPNHPDSQRETKIMMNLPLSKKKTIISSKIFANSTSVSFLCLL